MDKSRIMLCSEKAAVYDLSDGIAALVFESEDGTISSETAKWAADVLKEIEEKVKGLVITATGEDFCTGTDVTDINLMIREEQWDALENISGDFQSLTGAIRTYGKPVVTLIFGKTLDYGAELAICSPYVLAAEDLAMGFQTAKNGYSPMGGGLAEIAKKTYAIGDNVTGHDIVPFLKKAFQMVCSNKPSVNAEDAKAKGFLCKHTKIVAKDVILEKGKATAIYLSELGCQPEPGEPKGITVAGTTGKAALDVISINTELGGFISPKSLDIASWISWIISGGDVPKSAVVPEGWFLTLERKAFVNTCKVNIRG